MLNVALTGNIASGKSTVAALFERWGASLIDVDQLVREVQAPGTPVLLAIARRFGTNVIRPDGSLDRAHLRSVVFSDPQALADLNRLVHPAVLKLREARVAALRESGVRMVVTDIPLLYEAADPDAFDAVVLVDAPAELRRQRLFERSGLPPHEAERLIAAQMPSELKRERATFVIDNDRDVATLEARAREVWHALETRVRA